MSKMSPIFLIFLILSNIAYIHSENELTFDYMLQKVLVIGKMKTIAVAGGDNLTMLQCCRQAKDKGIANSILIGNAAKTRQIAKEANIDISDFELIDVREEPLIGLKAAQLVHDGKADIFAKGSLETSFCLKAIFDKKRGLKKRKYVSGITLFEVPSSKRFLIFTDSHVNPYPTLNGKVTLVKNAVEFAHSIGIKTPKVASVTANHLVNPKLKETMDSHRLAKMNEIGQIKGCIVDGPLSFDVAINPNLKEYKTKGRKIKGNADIILFPNLHSANIAYNLMLHVIHAKSGTLLTGTTAPVIFTSRAGSAEAKFYSVILSIFYSEYLQSKSAY